MAKAAIVLQDVFLNLVRKERTQVHLHCLDGNKLSGYVRGFDSFIVIMECAGKQVMVYKHAIASITTDKAVPIGQPVV